MQDIYSQKIYCHIFVPFRFYTLEQNSGKMIIVVLYLTFLFVSAYLVWHSQIIAPPIISIASKICNRNPFDVNLSKITMKEMFEQTVKSLAEKENVMEN